MCHTCDETFYVEQIEQTRKKMQDAAEQLGLSHPQVLYFSQELDKYHTSLLAKSCKGVQVG